MLVLAMELHFSLPYCHSLKEKRRFSKSLTTRLAQKFSLSVREVAAQDRWQRLVLGLSCSLLSESEGRELVERILRFVPENDEAQLIDSAWHLFALDDAENREWL